MSDQEDVPEEATPQQNRKRGRPSKPKSDKPEDPNKPKRPRGRPRGTTKKPKEDDDIPKKPRGRPRKAVDLSDEATMSDSSQTGRGRGRPPKQKKPRGRPRKSESARSAMSDMSKEDFKEDVLNYIDVLQEDLNMLRYLVQQF